MDLQEKLTTLQKKEGVEIHMNYGSGGYCVVIISRKGEHFHSYSWEFMDALDKATAKYYTSKDPAWQDEDTSPGIFSKEI